MSGDHTSLGTVLDASLRHILAAPARGFNPGTPHALTPSLCQHNFHRFTGMQRMRFAIRMRLKELSVLGNGSEYLTMKTC